MDLERGQFFVIITARIILGRRRMDMNFVNHLVTLLLVYLYLYLFYCILCRVLGMSPLRPLKNQKLNEIERAIGTRFGLHKEWGTDGLTRTWRAARMDWSFELYEIKELCGGFIVAITKYKTQDCRSVVTMDGYIIKDGIVVAKFPAGSHLWDCGRYRDIIVVEDGMEKTKFTIIQSIAQTSYILNKADLNLKKV